MTSAHPLSLPSLHALIATVYLARHDDRIAELENERRPGRPKAKELLELEDVRKRERSEYETGIGQFTHQLDALARADKVEVPDLTHPPTAKLLWTLKEEDTTLQPSHVDLLRQIRLFKDDPEEIVVSKAGRTGNMGLLTTDTAGTGEDWTSGVTDGGAMQLES
jgi:translation machinery-associated protein 16